MKGMSIGEAAQRSGCSVATARYYEELGLLREIGRSTSGRRVYGWPDVERLRLLRRLRDMDFPLETIRAFTAALDRRSDCLNVRDMALAHLELVRTRRKELEALERSLEQLTSTCSPACSAGPLAGCTIVDDFRALGDQTPRGA